jgi:hypothetical protein
VTISQIVEAPGNLLESFTSCGERYVEVGCGKEDLCLGESVPLTMSGENCFCSDSVKR